MAEYTDTNPPAFPRDHRHMGHNGMSLRDWFAGVASDSAIDPFRTYGNDMGRTNSDVQARYAYADAMLVLRDGQVLEGTSAVNNRLEKIARDFINKHYVSCAEATSNDGVYEEAPLLVEALAEVVGYYQHPEDEA